MFRTIGVHVHDANTHIHNTAAYTLSGRIAKVVASHPAIAR